MTSSEGPVVSLDLGPSNQSPPLLTLILSLLRSGPCGSEQPIHRERPVATQHTLRNCVDHLAAPSHIYATPRVVTKLKLAVEGHRLDNLPVPSVPWRPCTNLCFSCWILFVAKYNQLNSTHCVLVLSLNELSLLAQTLDTCIQIKVQALGHKKRKCRTCCVVYSFIILIHGLT